MQISKDTAIHLANAVERGDLNAPGEMLLVYVSEDGNGTVILNNGGVALS